ncbi:MAG: hypothetical protein V4686_03765 [Patescibacteria group bacterium]
MNPTLEFRNWKSLLEFIFGPKVKRVANKYTVTDSGGSGDVTKPTHLFHLEVTPIDGGEHKLKFVPNSDFPKGEEFSLKSLQSQLPTDVYGTLIMRLVDQQQHREELEQQSISISTKAKAA